MGSSPHAIPELIYLPRGRVLGDDFALPRAEYFIVLPALLALVGLSSWLLSDDLGFVFSSVVGALVGFYTLWGWLFRKQPTRFSTLLAMALLLGYGGGAVNTLLTLPRSGETMSTVMGLDNGVLSRGIGAVLLSAAVLFFVGEIYEKPIFGRDFRFVVDGKTRTLVCLGAVAMVGGYATHLLLFQGPNSAGGHLNPAGAFLQWFYGPVTAIAVTTFLMTPRGTAKLFCGAAAMILILLFAIVGRRNAAYTAIDVLLMIEISGYQWRGSKVRKTLIVVGLGAVVVVGSLAFMLLRIAGRNSSHPRRVTVTQQIKVASKMVQSGGAVALAGTSTQQNLQKRTFVLAFFANVLDGSMTKTPALGLDAVQQIQLAIPRIIYRDKDTSVSEENLDDRLFGFGYRDEANSILTAGATDFGLIGALIYPLMIVGLYRFVFEVLAKFLGLVPMMFIALSSIFVMIATEMTLTGYLETLRVLPFFGLAIAIFMAVPVIKLRNE